MPSGQHFETPTYLLGSLFAGVGFAGREGGLLYAPVGDIFVLPLDAKIKYFTVLGRCYW